jgi:hypothetical protein
MATISSTNAWFQWVPNVPAASAAVAIPNPCNAKVWAGVIQRSAIQPQTGRVTAPVI